MIFADTGQDLQVLKRLTSTDLGTKYIWESGLNTLFDWDFNKNISKTVRAQKSRQNWQVYAKPDRRIA